MTALKSIQELMNGYTDTDTSLPVWENGSYRTISTSAQTLVKSGPGALFGIMLNTTLVSAVRLYDNTVSGGTTVLTIPAAAAAGTNYRYGLKFATGLVVSSGAAADNFTIIYY